MHDFSEFENLEGQPHLTLWSIMSSTLQNISLRQVLGEISLSITNNNPFPLLASTQPNQILPVTSTAGTVFIDCNDLFFNNKPFKCVALRFCGALKCGWARWSGHQDEVRQNLSAPTPVSASDRKFGVAPRSGTTQASEYSTYMITMNLPYISSKEEMSSLQVEYSEA